MDAIHDKAVVTETFQRAEDFLNALSRRDPRWHRNVDTWIYRGHSDAAWPLTPSAFREQSRFRYGVSDEFSPQQTNSAQILYEVHVVRAFLIGLDKQGLTWPNYSAFHWTYLHGTNRDIERMVLRGDWPPEEFAPLVALAQHSGIPTRLLDWSERPLVAAYFAAVGAAQRMVDGKDLSGRMAVWALDRKISSVRLERGLSPEDSLWFRLVRAPRASNPNLHAQGGIFTLLGDTRREKHAPAEFPPLEEFLENRFTAHSSVFHVPGPVLRKLELPMMEAGKLLQYLDDEGVSGVSIYPGIEGVVRGLREHELWGETGPRFVDRAYSR